MTYSSTVLATSGLIAYWRLGESEGTNAVDEQGTADGTYANTPTLGATGLLVGDPNTAVTFALSANEHVSIATGIPAGSSSGASIEAWVKWTDLDDSAIQTIFRWKAQSTTVGFHWLYMDNRSADRDLYWQYADGTAAREAQSNPGAGTGIVAGTTYHIVAVHDYSAETVTFYINGSIIGTAIDVSAFGTPVSVLADGASFIGAYSATTYPIDATMDEVALYNVALSGTTVSDHYTAGTTAASQYLRPDADTADGGWATTPLWSKIEEETADGTVITATAS